MKKLLISLVCALTLVTGATAQSKLDKIKESLPPFKLGAQAGFNVSWLSQSGFNSHAGFNFGATAMFDAGDLIKDTYVRGSFLVNRIGYDGHGFTGVKETGNAWYLEIPVRYGYGYLLNNDWTLLGETGPYIAIGTGGTVKRDIGLDEDYFGGDVYDFDRFDFGWGFHVGALYDQHHQVMLGWDFGFVDLNNKQNIKNRNFMISYAYYFL